MSISNRLDLDRPRDFRDLVAETLYLWPRHLRVFLVLAAIVVVPADVLVVELDLGEDVASVAALLVVQALLVPALVTAVHVAAVLQLAEGGRPTVLGALRRGLPVALPALAATGLYLLGIVAGLALLVWPGLWFSVAAYFAPQAAVAERLGPVAAVRRSLDLVRYQWFRVLGIAIGFAFIAAATLGILAELAGSVVGDDRVISVAVACLSASFTALTATLLFFDLRARHPDSQVE